MIQVLNSTTESSVLLLYPIQPLVPQFFVCVTCI